MPVITATQGAEVGALAQVFKAILDNTVKTLPQKNRFIRV
jgi:hypothetical protein